MSFKKEYANFVRGKSRWKGGERTGQGFTAVAMIVTVVLKRKWGYS
jgi:hypothetical protein